VDIIDGRLDAVHRQTPPPDAILIVDNAATDGALDRPFPEQVRVIQKAANIGPGDAIPIGFRHALERGFDWMWILDHDSARDPEALAMLLDLYAGWSAEQGQKGGQISEIQPSLRFLTNQQSRISAVQFPASGEGRCGRSVRATRTHGACRVSIDKL